ncbi:MAG TPA: hypothetical protein DCL38_00960 [Lachnospiraceae bacterium]|nr:hypothetical protein [Lachnospiraceae bacterium]
MALTLVISVLGVSAKADDLDAQKAYLVGQINQGAAAQVQYEKLDKQKKALLKQIDGYVDRAKADREAHAELFEQQRINNIISESANYASYLQARITNVAEVTRIKKEVFDNYTALSKSNSQYAALIPAASADYQKALMDQYYAKSVADAARMFVDGPLIRTYAKNALSWYSGPQDAGKFVMQSIGIPTVY